MKRRLLGMLLMLSMLLALLPMAALAAEPSGKTEDGLSWKVEAGTLTISGNGSMQDYTASGFGDNPSKTDALWRDYAAEIRKVVVESGITSIGAHAFHGLPLTEASLPAGLTEIGNFAFFGAFAEQAPLQVTLPAGLKTIGRNAFAGSGAESITIPGTVEQIGDYAFSHLNNLKQLRFAEGFQTWSDVEYGAAVSANYYLETVYLPASLTGLPEGAFADCISIKDVYYGSTEADWNALSATFGERTTRFLLEKNHATVHFTETDPLERFTDLSKNWAYDAIAYCVANGLMSGTDSTMFSPKMALSRAMVVTILWRMCDRPAPTQESTFVDLSAKWYKTAVAWAQETGIVAGVDNAHFAPNQSITRQDFVSILCRFMKAMGAVIHVTDLDAYPDSGAVSNYARVPMQWAVSEGILSGTKAADGTVYLAPKDTTTREQAAAIFMRFAELEIELPADAA